MTHWRIKCLAIFFISWHLNVAIGYQLPNDVELLEGHELPQSLGDVEKSSSPETKEFKPTGLFKAIRNRRALYHIKNVPSIPEIDEHSDDDDKKELHKRDLSDAFGKMDVSAQYTEQLAIAEVDSRSKREATDTTKEPQEWIPQPSTREEENAVGNEESSTGSNAEALMEARQEKTNGREARTTNEWVKLPYLARPLDNEPLSSSAPAHDEVNHRMPRVNFVTQNKGLQASESRSQRESIPRGSYSRGSDLRTDIYPPNRGRSMDYSSYSRHSYYYPDDYRRRGYYDDSDYYDDLYYNNNNRRDPYDYRSQGYDYRYPTGQDYRNGRRYDYSDYKYRTPDDYYDYGRYDKPRRIIYYATLPDVVRTPPNVYRYPNSYSRYDEDRHYRDYSRGGFYYPRYPYSALKKSENEGPRDLSASSTANKEKAEALKRQQELQKKTNEERARDASLNSHQYPINLSANLNVDSTKVPHQTLYHDITRMDHDYQRYDHPSFQAAVDDPYVSRHD